MKNQIEQKSTHSKSVKWIIYSLGAAVLAFLLYVYFYQTKMYRDTINNGKSIHTVITNIDCISRKGKSRLYFINDRNEVQHVNVSYTDCQTFRRGDTISVYVSKGNDWYEIDSNTLRETSKKD